MLKLVLLRILVGMPWRPGHFLRTGSLCPDHTFRVQNKTEMSYATGARPNSNVLESLKFTGYRKLKKKDTWHLFPKNSNWKFREIILES